MRRTWVKVVLWTLAVLLLAAGILHLPTFYAFRKPMYYAHSVALDIAVGFLSKENHYDRRRAYQMPGMKTPTCYSENERYTGKAPYWNCITGFSNRYKGCGSVYDPLCVSVGMDSYILTKPVLFAKAVDALSHPCKYLPSPKDIERYVEAPARTDKKYVEDEKKYSMNYYLDKWYEARCDTHPDRYPGKVTLTIFEHDVVNPVLTIVKEKD